MKNLKFFYLVCGFFLGTVFVVSTEYIVKEYRYQSNKSVITQENKINIQKGQVWKKKWWMGNDDTERTVHILDTHSGMVLFCYEPCSVNSTYRKNESDIRSMFVLEE
jgi:hypothetical protein